MTLEEQIAHYSAVRKRIASATRKPRSAPVLPSPSLPAALHTATVIRIPTSTTMWARQVMRHICEQRGLEIDVLRSPNRTRPYTRARWEIMLRMYELGWSLQRVGCLLGLDHTTVLHGVRALKKLLKEGEYELCVLPAHLETPPFARNPAGGSERD
jgi:hypothetical protein